MTFRGVQTVLSGVNEHVTLHLARALPSMVPPPSASIKLNVILSCLFCSSDSLALMTCTIA